MLKAIIAATFAACSADAFGAFGPTLGAAGPTLGEHFGAAGPTLGAAGGDAPVQTDLETCPDNCCTCYLSGGCNCPYYPNPCWPNDCTCTCGCGGACP